MKKTIFAFGLLITALIFLFQLSKYHIRVGNYTTEIVISITSVVFFLAGVYFTRKSKPAAEPPVVPVQVLETSPAKVDHKKIQELGISSREMDVLNELVKGFTNREISERLFISESTTKTHVSNLFSKLGVKSRSQAIIRSNELNLVEKDSN